MLKARLTELPAESTTWMVKSEVPTAVGVPKIVTELLVLEDKERPAGRLPFVRLQVKVPVAPIAPMVPV